MMRWLLREENGSSGWLGYCIASAALEGTLDCGSAQGYVAELGVYIEVFTNHQ